VGQLFYFRSRIGNKNYRIVEVDLSNPTEANWRTVIEENPNYILQAANAVDKYGFSVFFVLWVGE